MPVNHLISQEPEDIKVTIRSVNKPLHEVLDDLTSQCGYNFTFDSRLTDSRRRINLNLKEITINEAIDTIFRNPDLTFRVIHRNIVIFPKTIREDTTNTDTTAGTPGILSVGGSIIDQQSGKPLPFATIAVMGTYYGTVSNTDGSFMLRIPDTIRQPILVSSYIGYKNRYIPVSFDSEDQVEISMHKTIISLQEVIIRYQDPVSLLTASIGRFHENYMNEPAGMQAYYRERVRKDDKSMIFSEAVVEIAKAPYNNPLANERTRLLKGRKITNIENQDTVVFKIRSGLITMLQLDIIRNPPGFLLPDFPAVYDFQYSDVVSFKDKLVYVISFKQKENVDETLFRGELYIDRESLAIIAADFEYDPVRLGREESMFVAKKSRGVNIRPLTAKYHVEYQYDSSRYHLAQVQGEVKFKVRKRRQWIASRYQINLDLVITNTDPGNPPRIRSGEQLKPATIISDQVFVYDAKFWGEYNTIAPEATLTEALKNIEKSLLEIQPGNNASNIAGED
ncbi:MAG: carboxypeptidase-like regulatory domain-containing protein [Bacteroidales bacterium]